MSEWILTATHTLLHWLAIPEVGLGAVFLIALVSATLLPMGSEPAVFGLVKLQPEMFWPAVLVATLGNTAGGAITWWMGRGAREAADRLHRRRDATSSASASRLSAVPGAAISDPDRTLSPEPKPEGGAAAQRAAHWLQRFGAPACLLSWLPVVGDPLCAVAGWLRLPFWPCLAYMAAGKLARYVSMTALLLHLV